MLALAALLALQCPDGAPPPCRRAGAAPPAHSVAVLYFDNRSGDSADAYLADGLTEEVISRLSGIERISVRSRHLVRRYRGTDPDPAAVARSLNVAYLVTGSVRRAGGRLRVSAELVQAGGTQVWGRQFDQSGDDAFAIQEAVAREVASGIVGRLIPSEQRAIAARPTRNTAAYDAFLRGNFHLVRRDSVGLSRAIREYENAIQLDSGYGDAMARLAMAYAFSEGNGFSLAPFDTAVARTARYASAAVRLAPRSPDSWLAVGMAREIADGRTLGPVLEALRRALQLDSSSAEAHHQLGTVHGKLFQIDSADWHHHRALAIDPRRPITLIDLGAHALWQGRWADGRRWFDSALVIEPEFSIAHAMLFSLALIENDTGAMRRSIATWATIPSLRSGVPWLNGLMQLRGTTDSATLARFREASIPPGQVYQPVLGAWVSHAMLAGLNDRHGALVVLEQTRPGAALASFLRGPAYDPLRGERRFQAVLRASAPR